MSNFSRRSILAAGAAGGVVGAAAVARAAATFGNPDEPAEGAVNVRNPRALEDVGPHDPTLTNTQPSRFNPPPTDVNGMPTFWSSFNLAERRIQNGGWARQVIQSDFAISKDIAGVNMRLGPGGVRELHWHQQAEWSVVTYGNCRVTILDESGRPQVDDLKEGDLWYFPAGLPHSLQGLEPDGTEFVLAFDNGDASENNTLLLTDWIAHTPPEILAKNFGVPVDAFKNIPLHNKYIYQSQKSAPPPDVVAAQIAAAAGKPPNPFVFRLSEQQPIKQTKSGMIQLADSTNFLVSKTIAATRVVIKPGGLRELHWHPNADERAYFMKGTARVGVFNQGPAAATADFRPGDIGVVPKALGHYIENTGTTDLVYMEAFKADRFAEVSLSDWPAHSPPDMVAETLNLDPSVIAQFPKNRPDVVPA
jgi:oxalate decarboxylase